MERDIIRAFDVEACNSYGNLYSTREESNICLVIDTTYSLLSLKRTECVNKMNLYLVAALILLRHESV